MSTRSLRKIRVLSKNSLTYRNAAKAAFKRALDTQYGSLGPASPVRRIDPKTGLPIADAGDIRKLLGPEVADRL
jgi:hypothetical protein